MELISMNLRKLVSFADVVAGETPKKVFEFVIICGLESELGE